MTINERMREVRKAAGLTQTEFAKRVGITMSSISQMERGLIKPTNQTIEFVCREFKVNRQWLETGEGEKERPPLDEVAEVLSEVMDEGEDDPFYQWMLALLKAYQKLDDRSRAVIQRLIDEVKGS